MEAVVVRGRWIVLILAAMMLLTPAAGVPREEMLQDTLKSAIVSFAALAAAFVFFWRSRKGDEPLQWHWVILLPLALMAYALGSMAWSHPYLGGVEAVRWFVLALIAWLALNSVTRDNAPLLAGGIHAGAVIASLWTALQFWADLQVFPQGPNPGSTFVNRNFFAEFAVCTLPFGAWLLLRAKRTVSIALLAASCGFVVTAIFMTGTRAALLATWVLVLMVLPLVAWRFRAELACAAWTRQLRLLAVGVFAGTVLLLGVLPTGNPKLQEEHRVEQRGLTPLARAVGRTQSIAPGDRSLGLRMVMWKATARMVEAHPVAGVGAGAWENEIPRYQDGGAQVETDYYVHNEFLQLVAEYGLVGWAFIAALLSYLVVSVWRTWRLGRRHPDGAVDVAGAANPPTDPRAGAWAGRGEGPPRAFALASLFALMVVSNVGFPWRMAATGALLALCIGMLAASDARLALRGWAGVQRLRWRGDDAYVALGAAFSCLAVAVFLTHRAVLSENRIVRAARMAVTISSSGDYANPRWDEKKREILSLASEGIGLNRHYRKITPVIGDELARWGDWGNAVLVWQSVLSSRPHVVAILCNVARGYVITGQLDKATEYYERAKAVQPAAPAVRSLEVILKLHSGDEAQALALVRKSIGEGIYDLDLTNAGFGLGARAHDYELARRSLELRAKEFPATRVRGYLQLGEMYAKEANDPGKALEAYRLALSSADEPKRGEVMQQIPEPYRSQVSAAR